MGPMGPKGGSKSPDLGNLTRRKGPARADSAAGVHGFRGNELEGARANRAIHLITALSSGGPANFLCTRGETETNNKCSAMARRG